LDKLLYDIDRAIDALSLGFDPDGSGIDSVGKSSAETRAIAYGLVVETLLQPTVVNPLLSGKLQENFNFGTFDPKSQNPTANCLYSSLKPPVTFVDVDLGRSLIRAVSALLPDLPSNSQWKNVTVADNGTVTLPNTLTGLPNGSDPKKGPTDPKKTILQELFMQKDAEDQWTNLLLTLAPSCFGTAQLLGDTSVLADAARVAHSLASFESKELSVPIPRDVATSLDQGVKGATS
jgi:hypothetical protein